MENGTTSVCGRGRTAFALPITETASVVPPREMVLAVIAVATSGTSTNPLTDATALTVASTETRDAMNDGTRSIHDYSDSEQGSMRDDAYSASHKPCENCGDTMCCDDSCHCCEPAARKSTFDPGVMFCSRECEVKYVVR